ncbi:MAG TPA: malto-oligosyltrehalose trehalohydrolase [Steroidobacteraceae bacterium]|jgi:maltooligosyltrehalose trehalohydrolase
MPTSFLGSIRARGESLFRVWAPQARVVEVVYDEAPARPLALQRQPDGYFTGTTSERFSLYKYRVDGAGPFPDPCSRFQPQGVHGPSLIVDPTAFKWNDAKWRGARLAGQVIYELHIGTFTPEGTFDAALGKLPYLRELGITMLEVMPVAQCPGRWNWGYDGVQLFAPNHVYGDYEALKRFVDRAHALGLAVILDVVYNHLGPDGNYLKCFSPYYFSTRHATEWGEALNLDGEQAQGTRDFILGNARYWLSEFHLDGLRLDATQSIFDDSRPHILQQLAQTAREAAQPRSIVIISENEPQHAQQLLPPERGGFGLDAMWNDDFHHAAKVALTGTRDGYFGDYTGRAQEFLSCVRRGFLYQGQWYPWQKQTRGQAAPGLAACTSIVFLQNHDQVGNTFLGDRVHATAAPGRYRTLMALTLLGPQTPMLFMGQEFAASASFMFFADHHPELAALVHKGRREFLGQFRAYADEAAQQLVPAPHDEATFVGSKLDWSEVEHHAEALAFHRDLIQLRACDPVLSQQDGGKLDGATLSEQAFVLRWFDAEHGDRLLVVNLDRELPLTPPSEPLLAPTHGATWQLLWSSEDPRYGGHGVTMPVADAGHGEWRLPAQSAVLLVEGQA